jgi:hypothetical protein
MPGCPVRNASLAVTSHLVPVSYYIHVFFSRLLQNDWDRLYKTLNHFFNHYFVVK